MRNTETPAVSTLIQASPDRLYEMVADVTRMGEWSPECYRCEWQDGATAAAPGARFKGHNKLGPFKWVTECVIEVADPGRELSFVAGDEKEGKTRWTYRFEPAGSETRVTESYHTIIPAPLYIRILERVMLLGRSRDSNLRKAMGRTLGRIAATAEQADAGSPARVPAAKDVARRPR